MATKIRLKCDCGQTLIAREELAGQVMRCPACGDNVGVPPLLNVSDPIDVSDKILMVGKERWQPKLKLPEAISGQMAKWQGLTVILILTASLIIQLVVAYRVDPRQHWEYKTVAPPDGLFDTEMNRLGIDGWEMISARRATTGGDTHVPLYEVIMKRRIK